MSVEPSKKVFIKTYGCQMNVYDSQRMSDVLMPLGYVGTNDPRDADLVILNTCHIREKAAEKVYSELGRLRRLKELKARRGSRLTTTPQKLSAISFQPSRATARVRDLVRLKADS